MAACVLLMLDGCTHSGLRHALRSTPPSPGPPSKVLAVYEPWFGHPRHIDVGYSSQDPTVIRQQIRRAKSVGISGFVVDWYGDREPFIDKSYALVQSIAQQEQFSVAMLYDETNKPKDEATDDALVSLQNFREKYLSGDARGRDAYLEYKGRPVIFIFPKGGQTDWNRVRAETNRWNPAPLLIYEYRQTPYASAFDGFYAWINPGKQGWSADGSHWGEDYLHDFYETMKTKYPDKIAVGTAWAGFDDRKASWGLGRFMSQRCGQTLADTMRLQREASTADNPQPFMLIATWNDYEEGSAIERGEEKCSSKN